MFTIIFFSIQGQLGNFSNIIIEKPFRIFFYLLQPIFILPMDVINSFLLFSNPYMIAMLFGFLFSPFIASIVAGIYGKDALKSFGGWCLTTIICLIMWMVLFSYDSLFRDYITSSIVLERAIITLILNGIVTCLLYGFCASFLSFMIKRISDLD